MPRQDVSLRGPLSCFHNPNMATKLLMLVAVMLGAFCWATDFGSASGYAAATANQHTASDANGNDAENTAENNAENNDSTDPAAEHQKALLTLAVGIVVVLGLIIGLKVNAFIALITAAIIVSLLAPGEYAIKISRVAAAFGKSTGGIGIVIAMAAVIGQCMLDSGAADRVVRVFLRIFGEKRAPIALCGSGFVLAVPVFFDTVFYLLVPLARSLHRKTGREYLKYILCIGAGGAITHTLVPPTPGPLMMAANLGFDVGYMIMIGAAVAFPAAIFGILFAGIANRLMPVPMRQIGNQPDPEPLDDSQLPGLFMSLLPVLLPVVLISANTVLTTMADAEHAALLTTADVKDWDGFQQAVASDNSSAQARVGKQLITILRGDEKGDGKASDAAERNKAVASLLHVEPLTDDQKTVVITSINQYVLSDKAFYTEEAFVGIRLSPTAKSLLGKLGTRTKLVDKEHMNRALLESAYPQLIAQQTWNTPKREAANRSALFGNANLALLLSAVIAMFVLARQRGLGKDEMARIVESSLMSAGVIILITAGGGAFGAMLEAANVGEAIKAMFSVGANGGLMYLVLGFAIASVLKVAQGSSTVAMITGSAMLAGVAQPETLHFHPAYLACAIGAGSLVGSWMNDSGFWIFAKMGGLTEAEALKSWSVMLVILGVVSLAVTVALASVMPLV